MNASNSAGPEKQVVQANDPIGTLGSIDEQYNKIALLKRRLDRERASRKAAEALLTDKSRELFEALTLVRDSEHRLQMALRASGEGIWDWSALTGRLSVHGLLLAGEPYEWPEPDLQKFLASVHTDDRDASSLAWRLHMAGTREDIDIAYRLRSSRGLRWLRVRGKALERAPNGHALKLAGTIKDITNQRRSEQSLNLMAHAFASTQDALAVVDQTGWIIEINNSLTEMTGTEQEVLLGMPLSDYLDLPFEAYVEASWRGESQLRGEAGKIPVEVTVTTVSELAGQARCFIVSMHDISERQRAATRLARLALVDTLTELPNRAALEKRLENDIAAEKVFALMILDLDGFKGINDSFGHGEGDRLLREVARRFSLALPRATIGRWGGDEFIVLLNDVQDEASVQSAAQTLINMQTNPFVTESGRQLVISPSMGAVLFPRDGDSYIELFRKADAAMYMAKSKGRNRLQMFEPSIEQNIQRRMKLESQLRIDAERSGFNFFAQPKVDRNQRHSGAELLVRWTTVDFGAVSPEEFIPMAEQTDAIELLGRQALQVAARLSQLLQEIGRPLPLAVNLSPRQLRNPEFAQIAADACRTFKVDPGLIEFELTESALADGINVVRPILQSLRAHGFGLALDDFGTGYSSLSHLRELPFQKVKIDRSFVRDVIDSSRAQVMVQSIIDLCSGLGLSTVAEGVETKPQFEALRDMGVHEFQGYLFSRPVPIDQWVDFLRVPDA